MKVSKHIVDDKSSDDIRLTAGEVMLVLLFFSLCLNACLALVILWLVIQRGG